MGIPLTLYGSAISYTISILSLTKYRSLHTRVILWLAIAAGDAVAIANIKDFTPDVFCNSVCALAFLQQTVFMGYLYRMDRADLGIPEHLPYLQRLKYALWMFCNYRGIGTRWRVSYVPPERVLGFRVERPSTRGRFVKIRILKFFLLYSGACLWYDPLLTPVFQEDDFSKEKEYLFRRLSEVTAREFKLRLYLCTQHVIPVWLAMNLWLTGVGILAVIMGGKPEDWPPLFGDIAEAYSLKRYWR